jgi:hypothetical protein
MNPLQVLALKNTVVGGLGDVGGKSKTEKDEPGGLKVGHGKFDNQQLPIEVFLSCPHPPSLITLTPLFLVSQMSLEVTPQKKKTRSIWCILRHFDDTSSTLNLLLR